MGFCYMCIKMSVARILAQRAKLKEICMGGFTAPISNKIRVCTHSEKKEMYRYYRGRAVA